MKLNKKMQYGLLLTLYLSRSGRACLKDIADHLKLSLSFLEQVANKLKKSNVIKSYRGAHGGYELVSEPTVKNVLDALGSSYGMNSKDFETYRSGQQEHRALAQCSIDMALALANVTRRKIRNIGLQSVANEVAVMNKTNPLSKAIN